MATHSIHPESDQGNDNLLQDIAKVYVAVQNLHRKAPQFWKEDNDPLMACMNCLEKAADAIEAKTVADCMALTVISHTDWQELLSSSGSLDRMEGKAIQTARQLILEQ